MKFGVFSIFLAISCASAEVVKFSSCKLETVSRCNIQEVRIDPCPEAASDLPCKVKRGKSAVIEFDYIADYNATELNTKVFWASPDGDLPFIGMERNACLSTQCPTTMNQKQTYRYTVPIHRKYPMRLYDIKWSIHNPENEEDICCFIMKLRIK